MLKSPEGMGRGLDPSPLRGQWGENWYAHELIDARSKYLRDWTLVKRARFNAAKRYESKQNASTLAFAIAGIVGIALPFFTAIFEQDLVKFTRSVLDFYGYFTGSLALGVGLVEQARGYGALSRRFDECGRRVNATVRSCVASQRSTNAHCMS